MALAIEAAFQRIEVDDTDAALRPGDEPDVRERRRLAPFLDLADVGCCIDKPMTTVIGFLLPTASGKTASLAPHT